MKTLKINQSSYNICEKNIILTILDYLKLLHYILVSNIYMLKAALLLFFITLFKKA